MSTHIGVKVHKEPVQKPAPAPAPAENAEPKKVVKRPRKKAAK